MQHNSCSTMSSTMRNPSVSDSMSLESMDSQTDILGEYEYETQYFGFTPKSFCDGVYNAVTEYINDALTAAEDYMGVEFEGRVSRDQLRQSTKNVYQVFRKATDRAFDKFEGYLLSNIFYVPNNVVLPEDAVHLGHEVTFEEEAALDRDITELTDKIRATKYVNAHLKEELVDLKTAQHQHDLLLNQITTLEGTTQHSSFPDVKKDMAFSAEHAKKLMQLLAKQSALTVAAKVEESNMKRLQLKNNLKPKKEENYT